MDIVLQVVVGDGRALGGWEGYILSVGFFAESQTAYTPELAHRRASLRVRENVVLWMWYLT